MRPKLERLVLHKSMKIEQQLLEQIVKHFGGERLIAELPQHEVCKALNLVTAQELADSLGLSYDELRWKLKNREIPEPSFKLVKRCFYRNEEAEQIRSRFKNKK